MAKRKDNDNADEKKADFSAYWSLKVRQFFSSRRQYLEGADKKAGSDQPPEILRKLAKDIEQQQQALAELKQSRRAAKLAKEEQQVAAGRAQFTSVDQAALDIQQAREHLHTPRVKTLSLTLQRVQQLARAVVLAPLTLAAMAWQAWHQAFSTQRYELFLMSEGERIWYWRNRTENERWFWEVFAWDRLLFPILCTIAYEYVVPNNLLWAAVVPATFIMFQTGKLPGPGNLEFWLIAYFGVYKKCWGDVLSILAAVFCWA